MARPLLLHIGRSVKSGHRVSWRSIGDVTQGDAGRRVLDGKGASVLGVAPFTIEIQLLGDASDDCVLVRASTHNAPHSKSLVMPWT